jgi:hypothetical protein
MLGEKEIWLSGSGRHVKIGQLSALEARHTACTIVNVLGKSMQGTIKVDPTKGMLEQDVDLVGILGSVLERLDEKTVDALTTTFAKRTKVETDDGKWTPLQSVIDVVFGGGEGLADWFEWLRACIEFSCGPFFLRLPGLTKPVSSFVAPAPAEEASKSPTESTGSSTASPRVRRIEVSR